MGHSSSRTLTVALLLISSNAEIIISRAGGGHRSGLVRIPLLHRDELDVFGRVRIGAQTLDVVFDTGSSETWVSASAAATNGRPGIASCSSDEQYDEFIIEYGGGRVAGRAARRAIHLVASAPHTEVTLPSMWMGYVDRDSAVLDEIRVDGVLGLGMEALQQQWTVSASSKGVSGGASGGDGEENMNDAGQRPLLLELLAKGSTMAPLDSGIPLVFSIFINSALHREEDPSSQLILGGVDPELVSHNSTWSFFPVVSYTHNEADGYGFWALRLCSMAMGDQLLLFGREEGAEQSLLVAVVDSGSSLILLPASAFHLVVATLSREFGTRFSCSQRDHSAFESFECDCRRCSAQEFPDLKITLGSNDGKQQTLVLHGTDYVWCGRRRLGECSLLLDVDASATDDHVVLGAVFLRAFYTAFDYSNKRISLARPVHHASHSSEPHTSSSVFGWRSVAVALAVLGGSMFSLVLIATLD